MVDTPETTSQRQPIERPCRVCGIRPYEREYTCPPCRTRIPFRVRDLGELYDALLAEDEPEVDDRTRTEDLGRPVSWHPAEPGGTGGDTGTRGRWGRMPPTIGQTRDPVGSTLPSHAVASKSRAPRVGGSRDPAAPIDLARADLLAPAIRLGGRPVRATPELTLATRRDAVRHDQYQRSHYVPQVTPYRFVTRQVWSLALQPAGRDADGRLLDPPPPAWELVTMRLPERSVVRDAAGTVVMVPTGDQTGHPSIAQVLDSWMREIHALRLARYQETRPRPEVPALLQWLTDRLEWAFDHYDGIGDLAWSVASLCSTIRAVLGQYEPDPPLLLGVPCRRCDFVSCLVRVPGGKYIECTTDNCPELYTEAEYARWNGLVLADDHLDLPKPVKAMLLRWRCPGCKRYLNKCLCGWSPWRDQEGTSPEPADTGETVAAPSAATPAVSGPCGCACHVGGAFRPACDVVGGCGSIGCDGHGRIRATT